MNNREMLLLNAMRLALAGAVFLVAAVATAVVFSGLGRDVLFVLTVFFAAISAALAFDHGVLTGLLEDERESEGLK